MGSVSEADEEWSDSDDAFWDEIVDMRDYAPRNKSPQMFRAVAWYPANHVRNTTMAPVPYLDNTLIARNPGAPLTWANVRVHLRWYEEPTPFISFFKTFDMALRWKNNFIRAGAYAVRIFCYNTRNVALLDANQLARTLEFNSLEKLGKKHYHEYLAVSTIHGSNCAGFLEFRE
jgi:hypothetical protein